MYGFDYKSPVMIGQWPLVHICMGIDPLTMRPRAAKGILAIGNIAIGGVALGGLAWLGPRSLPPSCGQSPFRVIH
jgi:hypothetical protein